LHQARALLANEFNYCDVSCNNVAHELSQLGLRRNPGQPCVWSDPLPNFVVSLVDYDITDPML